MHIPLYNPLLVTTEFQDKKKGNKEEGKKTQKARWVERTAGTSSPILSSVQPFRRKQVVVTSVPVGASFFFSFVSYSFFFSPPLFSFLFQVSSLLLTLFTALSFLCGFSFAPFQTAGGTLAFFRFSVSPRPCRRKQAGSCGHVATVIAGKGRRDGKG